MFHNSIWPTMSVSNVYFQLAKWGSSESDLIDFAALYPLVVVMIGTIDTVIIQHP